MAKKKSVSDKTAEFPDHIQKRGRFLTDRLEDAVRKPGGGNKPKPGPKPGPAPGPRKRPPRVPPGKKTPTADGRPTRMVPPGFGFLRAAEAAGWVPSEEDPAKPPQDE